MDVVVPAASPAPSDLVDQPDAGLVGGDTGAVHPASVRADAAPDLDQSPVAEQILVEEDPVAAFPGQLSTFNSRPGITADGIPYWVGGITDTQGGS